jgi:hypothetical protein
MTLLKRQYVLNFLLFTGVIFQFFCINFYYILKVESHEFGIMLSCNCFYQKRNNVFPRIINKKKLWPNA